MPTITLTEPWTYRTPLVTFTLPAGEHEVDEDVLTDALADPAAQVAIIEQEDADNGDGDSTARAPRRARKAKG